MPLLSPTQERREEIVQNVMEQTNLILEFNQALDEDIRYKISNLDLANLGALAIALETLEREAEEAIIAINNNIASCEEIIGGVTNDA